MGEMAPSSSSPLSGLPVTSLTTAALSLLVLRMSFGVINLRRKHKVMVGDGGKEELTLAIRAHANLLEYSPFALFNLACLELGGVVPSLAVAAAGATFTIGRLLHYRGMTVPLEKRDEHIKSRVLGMQLTLSSLGALALANVGATAYQLIFFARSA